MTRSGTSPIRSSPKVASEVAACHAKIVHMGDALAPDACYRSRVVARVRAVPIPPLDREVVREAHSDVVDGGGPDDGDASDERRASVRI
jgi:hypothetical protein